METFEEQKQQFLSFIKHLEPNKKVAILAHGNCSDGMASAVLLTQILNHVHPTQPTPFYKFIFYGVDMFTSRLIDELKQEGVATVFVLDIGVNLENIENIERLSGQFSVCYIDHHPTERLPSHARLMIHTDSLDCASLVLYRLGKDCIDDSAWHWLVCAVAFSEFSYKKTENIIFLQQYYPTLTLEYITQSVPATLSYMLGSLIIYYRHAPLDALNLILQQDFTRMESAHATISEEINRHLATLTNSESYFNKTLYFYKLESSYSIGSAVATAASLTHRGATIVIYSRDVEDATKLKISARNNLEPIPYSMRDMLAAGIAGLPHATSGGHVPASAAVIRSEDFDRFKRQVIAFVQHSKDDI